MQTIVGVRFRPAGKIYYFDPDGEAFVCGEKVIVETARGLEFGEICCSNREVPDDQITAPLKKVVRRASRRDEEQLDANRARENEALATCEAKIREHNLPMSLVGAEYTFDGQKLLFYFTAENRVDFRELVRDLAATFKTRIELRQIGVRDEAKMLGGLGPCGRSICCATFLGDFQPVSIRMAKEQNLSLNPTKISGLCGRLMCCLRYECEHYNEGRDADRQAAGPAARPEAAEEELLGLEDVEQGTQVVECPYCAGKGDGSARHQPAGGDPKPPPCAACAKREEPTPPAAR